MAKGEYIGMDFGTSNSSVAVTQDGETKFLPVQTGKTTQPSCLFLDAGEMFSCVGYRAIYEYMSPKKEDNYHFVPSIKPGLHIKEYDGITLQSQRSRDPRRSKVVYFPVEEMAGMVIDDLSTYAEFTLGYRPQNVVMGRPVRFSEKDDEDQIAQMRLERAAKQRGYQNVHFVYEPVAAGVYAENQKPVDSEQIALVFDFGGGTLDTACIKLKPEQFDGSEELEKRVLSAHGIDLGGTDLDKDVFRSRVVPTLGQNAVFGSAKLPIPAGYYADLTEWHLQNTQEKEKVLSGIEDILYQRVSDPKGIKALRAMLQGQEVYQVLQAIETGKLALSLTDKTNVTYHSKDIEVKFALTRPDFEQIIQDRISSIEDCVLECLIQAGLAQEDIDTVIKVGGSSQNPFVDKMLRSQFNNVSSTNTFNAVAGGLAIIGSRI